MILIGYDGSADAGSAIRHAGELMPGEAATVLTVWEPFVNVVSRSGGGIFFGWPGEAHTAQIDARAENSARASAGQGFELAREAGLNPQPCVRARGTTIAEAILSTADEVGARAIVLGTHGLTGLKSLMLGSVSRAVVQHSHLPVMVVPSPRLARRSAEASERVSDAQGPVRALRVPARARSHARRRAARSARR